MKSISEKILKGTIFCLFLIVILMTIVSIEVVSKISKNDSEIIITQTCEKETLRFNNEFSLLENSVTNVYTYIQDLEDGCSSEEEMLTNEFCDKIQYMTLSIANRTDGAMAVYFRYNPEITGNGTQGFFWSRNSDEEKFSYYEPTDILQYDQNDTEHVGWFYEPKEKGKAVWLSPYYNKNLDVFMISYVIPYYTESGEFLGVIGMDIDFNKIVQLTSEVSLYGTEKIYLVDLSTYYMYSTDSKNSVVNEDMSLTIYNHITTIDKESGTMTWSNDSGQRYLTCVARLTNGMRLMLTVPASEINAQRNNMLILFLIIMIVSFFITVFFIVRITNKIVKPLKILTRITGKYAKGDWEETFISHTMDEIQELSESISVMAKTTRKYIDKINAVALIDGLTGLKNRNCYLSYIEKYKNWSNAYAVVVFDINFLKKANDQFGHEAGDVLIKRAGKYICETFTHSPVFRIGGDEFTAILEKRDYESKEMLCEQFMKGLQDLPEVVGDIHLSISYGIASFPEDGASYDEIFNCADERMYERKIKMKVARE